MVENRTPGSQDDFRLDGLFADDSPQESQVNEDGDTTEPAQPSLDTEDPDEITELSPGEARNQERERKRQEKRQRKEQKRQQKQQKAEENRRFKEDQKRIKDQAERAKETSENVATPEAKDAALTALIEMYASMSEEDMDQDNPFRERTDKEKSADRRRSLYIKVGVGVLFGAGVVAVGWATIPAAAIGMGVSMASSSASGFLVDKFRQYVKTDSFNGEKVSAEQHEQKILKELFDREKSIRALLKNAAVAVVAAREGEYASEHLRQMAVDQAKYDFINQYVELRNNTQANKESEDLLGEYRGSQKKWGWIKGGAAVLGGVIGGGLATHGLEGMLQGKLEQVGVHMATDQGMGRVQDVLGLQAHGHNVRLIHDGIGDQMRLVFDYTKDELAILGSQQGQQAIAHAGLEFNSAAAMQTGSHAMAGTREAASVLAAKFGQRVAEELPKVMAANFTAVGGAVISGEAGSEIASYMAANNFENGTRLFKPLNTVIGGDNNPLKRRLEASGRNQQNAEASRFLGFAPEALTIGREFILKNDLTQPSPQGQVTYPAGTMFAITGVALDGVLRMVPVGANGNQLLAFEFSFPPDKRLFVDTFEAPETLLEIQRNTLPPTVGNLVKNIHDNSYGQVVMIYPATGEVAVGTQDNPQDQSRWVKSSYDSFANNYRYIGNNRPPIYEQYTPTPPAERPPLAEANIQIGVRLKLAHPNVQGDCTEYDAGGAEFAVSISELNVAQHYTVVTVEGNFVVLEGDDGIVIGMPTQLALQAFEMDFEEDLDVGLDVGDDDFRPEATPTASPASQPTQTPSLPTVLPPPPTPSVTSPQSGEREGSWGTDRSPLSDLFSDDHEEVPPPAQSAGNVPPRQGSDAPDLSPLPPGATPPPMPDEDWARRQQAPGSVEQGADDEPQPEPEPNEPPELSSELRSRIEPMISVLGGLPNENSIEELRQHPEIVEQMRQLTQEMYRAYKDVLTPDENGTRQYSQTVNGVSVIFGIYKSGNIGVSLTDHNHIIRTSGSVDEVMSEVGYSYYSDDRGVFDWAILAKQGRQPEEAPLSGPESIRSNFGVEAVQIKLPEDTPEKIDRITEITRQGVRVFAPDPHHTNDIVEIRIRPEGHEMLYRQNSSSEFVPYSGDLTRYWQYKGSVYIEIKKPEEPKEPKPEKRRGLIGEVANRLLRSKQPNTPDTQTEAPQSGSGGRILPRWSWRPALRNPVQDGGRVWDPAQVARRQQQSEDEAGMPPKLPTDDGIGES